MSCFISRWDVSFFGWLLILLLHVYTMAVIIRQPRLNREINGHEFRILLDALMKEPLIFKCLCAA